MRIVIPAALLFTSCLAACGEIGLAERYCEHVVAEAASCHEATGTQEEIDECIARFETLKARKQAESEEAWAECRAILEDCLEWECQPGSLDCGCPLS